MADKVKAEYEVNICQDCIFGHEYDEWETERQKDVFYRNFPGDSVISLDVDEDTGEIVKHFSRYDCDGCSMELAGDRFKATITEWEN